MVLFILIAAFIAIIVAYVIAIEFPSVAPQLSSAIDAIIYYLGQAMDIVWLFVPKEITITLMTLAIAVDVIVLGYKFIMWILRKIPVAGID